MASQNEHKDTTYTIRKLISAASDPEYFTGIISRLESFANDGDLNAIDSLANIYTKDKPPKDLAKGIKWLKTGIAKAASLVSKCFVT